MVVYVVSVGCYSDYRIHSVYSRKELAESTVDKLRVIDPYEPATIEEYDVDDPESTIDKVGAIVYENGSVILSEGEYETQWVESNRGTPEGDIVPTEVYFTSVNFHPDKMVMIKAARDKRNMAQAEKEGLT